MDQFEPVIICPHRFLEDVVFETIREKFFPDWESVQWAKEVNMGVSGSIDYVAIKSNNKGEYLDDFFCVEFQANGTTGSPYPYVRELLATGKYQGKHTYGLNWANEFLKTMMQQVYKKGQVMSQWNRKIVFVIQDVALQYLENNVDTSDLRMNMNDVVHFMTYSLREDQQTQKLRLYHCRWMSADLDGINKILAGAHYDNYVTEQDFLEIAIRKSKEDNL